MSVRSCVFLLAGTALGAAPNGKIDFSKQIPKKSDQRQMEAWQRIGTYAAGLALDAALALRRHALGVVDHDDGQVAPLLLVGLVCLCDPCCKGRHHHD